jgi:adenosine deaminase
MANSETLRKAQEIARKASNLSTVLQKFFLEESVKTIEQLMVCSHEEILDNRAYLLALEALEKNLESYVIDYNIEIARRQHVRTSI